VISIHCLTVNFFDNCRFLNNNQLKRHVPEILGEMCEGSTNHMSDNSVHECSASFLVHLHFLKTKHISHKKLGQRMSQIQIDTNTKGNFANFILVILERSIKQKTKVLVGNRNSSNFAGTCTRFYCCRWN
jgi:hypothetical protein